nr:MAG TPA: hypothetical protein [Caudoviricetes sp.]
MRLFAKTILFSLAIKSPPCLYNTLKVKKCQVFLKKRLTILKKCDIIRLR